MNDTRDRIVKAALGVFFENGYEESSVRMILDASGAATGSFYHFFKSKEELFEAALGLFLDGYAARFDALAQSGDGTVIEKVALLLDAAEEGTKSYYGRLGAGGLHWTVQCALHERTMRRLQPSVRRMLEAALERGEIKNASGLEANALASALLGGLEGILHSAQEDVSKPGATAALKRQTLDFARFLLGAE